MLLAIVDIIALLVLRSLVFVMRWLPFKLAKWFARGFLAVIFLFMPRVFGVGRRNLEAVFPEKPPEERERILKDSIWVFAKNLVWFAKLPTLNKEWILEHWDMNGMVDTVLKVREHSPTGGVILPTLHFGTYEICPQVATFWKGESAVLARGLGLPRTDTWIDNRREQHGLTIFSRKGGYQEVSRRLKGGELVVILFDQNVKRNHAVFVDFMGIEAATTKTIALAAIRTGCPIVFLTSANLADHKFKSFVSVCPHTYKKGDDVEEFTRRVLEFLHGEAEKVIRQYPEQWFWIHRRFKTRPPGESENFYDNI